MMRVPGILAGLNERSQSAYAAPSPKPVDSPMGHVRPVGECKKRSDLENAIVTDGGRG